jgi:GNAT superfamily N-acetyltransferase
MPPQALTEERVARWERDLTSGPQRWWAAERDGRIVGLVSIGPSRDPVDDELGELDTVAVDPREWRKGVGRALMSAAIDGLRAAGYAKAILWTVAGYERGRIFYESTGWQADGGARDDGRQVSFRRTVR